MAKKKSKSTTIATAAEVTAKKKRKHESPLTQQQEQQAITLSNNDENTTTLKITSKQRRSKTKSQKVLQEEAEERRLTAMLFGGGGGGGDNNGSGRRRSSSSGKMNNNNNNSNPEVHFGDAREEGFLASSQPVEGKEQLDDNEDDESPTLLFEIDRTGATVEQHEHKKAGSNTDYYQQEPQQQEMDSSDDDESNKSHDDDDNDNNKAAAWIDEDDDNVQVDLLKTDRLRKLRTHRAEDTTAQPLKGSELGQRLRSRYKDTMQVTAQTKWAQLDDERSIEGSDQDNRRDDDDDDDDDNSASALQLSSRPLLLQGGTAAASSLGRLPPNILNVVRCPDANQADYNKAVVQAVQFHPGSDPNRPLLLTGGLDMTLRFFQVGTESSEKIHGIHFPKLPIYSAAFLGDTGKVVVSGRRPFFYIYDSIAGKLDLVPRISGREERSLERCVPSPDGKLIAFMGNDGYIILVDVLSKQWIANLKLNGSVRAVSFTPDGEFILASGSDGDVYRFCVKSRRCVERFPNQDGTITSYMATSTRRHMAVGSESGVVNLYSDDFSRRQNPTIHEFGVARSPIKSILNLQTSVDMMQFNHDGQILAMSSRREKNSMKLLHVPTSTVFSNWPTSKTPLNYVWSMDFSPQSKFLAVGNDQGKCLLYRLQHYSRD